MKKKIILSIIIIAIFSVIFVLNRKNPDTVLQKQPTVLNEYQLEAYLNIKGWQVTKLSSNDIRIPQEFSGNFKTMSDELKKSGFDLKAHKGETVTRHVFSVDNYGESGINAELYITKQNELIGAVLIQQKPDGFIKPV
ncbi:MAG: DUF4830 domain-containing protein [Clostridium sp.]|nr:DUF4830 domain-containing protein [Clostridium sp.]MCM1547492.1 DUF4830 domain-containing protein [Ruminococcus sp.]